MSELFIELILIATIVVPLAVTSLQPARIAGRRSARFRPTA